MGLQPGDFVLRQFGHNDGGPLDDAKARASLKGRGDESRVVTNKVSGKVETVHSYTYNWNCSRMTSRNWLSPAVMWASLVITSSRRA
jgi:rhamnogalacturonan acetylesterase